MDKINNTTWKSDKIKNVELDKIGEKKDEISVIIGDDKQPDFIPQIKLCRWTNEVNFSLRRKDYQEGTTKTTKDKITWENSKEKIEFYDGDNSYKLVWFLKEKPKTNKVEFTIQSKGLDFFYQPELTQKEKDEGVSRPENVVGSYAVYHSTKGGMNDINGKEYKVGKAFHIYRPHIIDAEGKETWGILKIENGIYSVEIPQEFLDKAVYPIKSNDTFGWESKGGSSGDLSKNWIQGPRPFTCPENGEAVSITMLINPVGNDVIKAAFYGNINDDLVAYGGGHFSFSRRGLENF